MRIRKQKTCWYSLILITAFVSIVLLNNCGYSIHRHAALPFTEIEIGLIENKTLEPRLQDRLHTALTEEFLKQGISINPGAKLKLTGIIHKFQMLTLSEKKETTIEYRVIINTDFILLDEKGNTKEIKNIRSPFIVSFTGSEDFGRLIGNKEIAEERALRDIAIQIVGSLIYR